MLIINTMVHLRSEIPIQCRPPVANSQLANRENISGENLPGTVSNDTTMPPDGVVGPAHGVSTFRSTSGNNFQQEIAPQQVVQLPVILEVLPFSNRPPDRSQSFHSSYASHQNTRPSHPLITSSFGYNPTTVESLIPLSALPSKNHNKPIGISYFTCR